ncbi:hypothetical protein [Lactococcus termiticola]|uniref:Uncharacterized protein n=1 Tax=Lactococcus termiticola TaxID=2169526 RepID=A0A2R5HKB3_9LACT|nr:hypothetical protein [Lactococcus termiticola]GBG97240.1 hypothetical protein NtB2_01378 [Lactococcus termiticola]
MTYQIKIIYPKEESAESNKMTERTYNEIIEGLDNLEVVAQYENLLSRGYSINVTFTPPEVTDQGEDADPFEIANRFDMAGIPYKATLKLKASGNYEAMSKIAKMIEAQDFDYDVSVKLNIKEASPVDFEKEATWFDRDYAKYTILPKASSQDIANLKSLYEQLLEENLKVTIALKAKVPKDDNDSFADQLAAYPDETTIAFRLSDANIYGE